MTTTSPDDCPEKEYGSGEHCSDYFEGFTCCWCGAQGVKPDDWYEE